MCTGDIWSRGGFGETGKEVSDCCCTFFFCVRVLVRRVRQCDLVELKFVAATKTSTDGQVSESRCACECRSCWDCCTHEHKGRKLLKMEV